MGASVRKSLLADDHNLEIFSLVWLDASVNTGQENINVQQQLRTLIHQLKTFDNTRDCLEYIRHISKTDRIILIVSGRLGQEIVPRIHRLRQVSIIYVYCMNKEKNSKWARKYSKIKNVIVNLDELVVQIRSDRAKRNYESDEPLPFNIYKKSVNDEKVANDSNNQFIYSGSLIDCLLHMPSYTTDQSQLISLCRDIYKGDANELLILNEFEQTYTSNNALWWYTRDSFVMRLLNKAFQEQTIDLLYLFRFFLHDVQDQLKRNRCVSPIRVYRGQFLSNDELQTLNNSIGGLISMNSFLLAHSNRQKALKHLTESDELRGILFEIDADPRLDGIKPFGYTGQDDEILFMVGSIFRINDIHRQHDGLSIIRITLCSDNDPQLKLIFKDLKFDTNDNKRKLLSFGDILWRMGKLTEAEKYYQRLLTNLSGDDYYNISECYYALGNIAMEKDNCNLSYEWHEKSLEIKKQTLEEFDPSIADSYSSIADIERKKGNSSQAFESYNKALDIWIKAYDGDHPKIAMCLNNIGCIYGEEKNYIKTLECHEKSLKILKKHFPADHLCLGQAYNNIGSVYRYLGNYELALENYQLSLKIKTKSFSSKHPSIASTFSNIACVYEEMNEFQLALAYYEKAASIYRHNFPPTYPDNVRIIDDIKRISSKLK
ncbi:unnamed protein product [Adineta steineri]|uniref:Uncharacterized protein n=1 Tax=Adineta steineri TaxID=433720 RepID=A0A818VH17_9BILA|nr:unnamed protein product [Adineta steineri]